MTGFGRNDAGNQNSSVAKALPLRPGFSMVFTKALPLRNLFRNSLFSLSQEREGSAS